MVSLVPMPPEWSDESEMNYLFSSIVFSDDSDARTKTDFWLQTIRSTQNFIAGLQKKTKKQKQNRKNDGSNTPTSSSSASSSLPEPDPNRGSLSFTLDELKF